MKEKYFGKLLIHLYNFRDFAILKKISELFNVFEIKSEYFKI